MNLDLKSYVVWVENFSLVEKRSTTGLTDKRRVFCSACKNAVKLQMPLSTTSREENSYAAFFRRLKSYLRSTMTQEQLNHIAVTSCHSEIVKKLRLKPIA